MLISTLLKKLQKIQAQKVIEKNVMEKCTFSTFNHVHEIGFHITFCCVHFLATFSTVLKSANSAFFDIFFSKIIFLRSYKHFKQPFAIFEAKSAQNGSKNGKNTFSK